MDQVLYRETPHLPISGSAPPHGHYDFLHCYRAKGCDEFVTASGAIVAIWGTTKHNGTWVFRGNIQGGGRIGLWTFDGINLAYDETNQGSAEYNLVKPVSLQRPRD